MPSKVRAKSARPKVPCAKCGKVSRRSAALCAGCLGYTPNVLAGGRWVLRGAILRWEVCEKPPQVQGSECFAWENRGAPDRCANTTSGANRRINSTEPRSEG